MMLKLVLGLLVSLSAFAKPGQPFITSGGFAQSFLPINIQNQCYIITGTADPTSSATNAPKCSMYLSTNGNGYIKQDAGSTTNWSALSLSGGVTSVTASAPLASSGGTTPNLTITQSTTSTNGYLSSIDWNTFNGKQAAGNYITALTGDVTASGPGSVAATVALVGGSTAANVNTATALVNTAQSGNKVFASPSGGGSGAPAFRVLVGADLPNPSASTLGGIQSKAAVTSNFLTAISTLGVVSSAQPAFTDISGSVAAAQMPALTGDVTTSAGAVATTIANLAVTNAKIANTTIDLTAKVTGILPNANTTAASANTASAIVTRDGSGNFIAGTITAALTGTASGNTTYTANNHGVVISSATNAMTVTTPGTNAQVLTGVTGSDPTFQSAPAAILVVQTKTANYTALVTDDVIFGNTNAFTVTLYAASAQTKPLKICKLGTDTNVITIARAGSDTFTVAGTATTSTILHRTGECVTLVSDVSSKWYFDQNERDERAQIASGCGSTTAQSGNWVGSLSSSGTGFCKITFTTGAFSTTPQCTCIAGTPTVCGINNASSTFFEYKLVTPSTTLAVNDTAYVICQGQR